MKPSPTFDDIFAVMSASSVGETNARVAVPDDPRIEDLATRFAIALNLLLDDLAQRATELSASEARKSAILKSALDSIVSMDHEGKIVEFNPAAEKMFRYGCVDVIGKSMAETIVPLVLRQKHRDGLAHYLATGEGPVLGKRLELTAMRSDGSEFPVELAIVRVDLPGPPLFTGFIRDLTDRNRQERELRKADEDRKKLLAHLVIAQEDERRRIASDVHDDSIQVMAAVGLRLGMLKGQLVDQGHLEIVNKLEDAVQSSIGRLRHLLFQLAPPALEREGLAAAITTYLEEAFAETGVSFELDSSIARDLSAEVRTLVYRIAQEALSNVRKHAQATRVDVRLREVDQGVLATIRDDGAGFKPEDADVPLPGHLGLVSMRERAEMLGGWFRIEGEVGAGTSVEFWVPSDDRAEPDR